MEENNLQSTTMNLGVNPAPVSDMNLSGIAQPVVDQNLTVAQPINQTTDLGATVTTTTIPAQTIPAQTIPAQTIPAQTIPAQNVVSETTNTQSHSVVEKEIKLESTKALRVKIKSMRAIMANTEKAIVANSRIALSTVTQLKFTSKGLNVIASDNNVFICQNDDHFSYEDQISIGVDTLLFKALVDKINADEFTMIYNDQNRTITLKVGEDSEYVLQEQYARESGEVINIELPQDMLAIPTKPLNDILKIQDILKSMAVFACETDAHKEAYGVYIDPESISANDTDNMCIRKNDIPAFEGITLFPSLPLVKILRDIDLGNIGEIGFKVDEGRNTISRLIIKTKTTEGEDKVTLIAPVNEEENYQDYPLDTLKALSKSQYSNIFEIPKADLLSALDRLSLFVEENDSNAVTFDFKPGYLELQSTKNNGKERIKLPNTTATLATKKIDVRKLLNVLKYLSDKNISIKIDDAIDNMFSLVNQDLIITLSVVD